MNEVVWPSEELRNRNDVLFAKLVPFQGKCETAEGETLRAVNKIVYRYYNDGDRFFKGYGCETAGPAHAYLTILSPIREMVVPILAGMEEVNDRQYERGLVELLDTVVSHIELQLRLDRPLTPNSIDMLDSEPQFEDEEDYE